MKLSFDRCYKQGSRKCKAAALQAYVEKLSDEANKVQCKGFTILGCQ